MYGFCGETISPKSVRNTVQVMWVSHIKLTGKPCIVLIFQQFQLILSEFKGNFPVNSKVITCSAYLWKIDTKYFEEYIVSSKHHAVACH